MSRDDCGQFLSYARNNLIIKKLIQNNYYCLTTADGTKIFLNGGTDLSVPLSRVEKAGGKVVLLKQK